MKIYSFFLQILDVLVSTRGRRENLQHQIEWEDNDEPAEYSGVQSPAFLASLHEFSSPFSLADLFLSSSARDVSICCNIGPHDGFVLLLSQLFLMGRFVNGFWFYICLTQ